MSIIFETQKAVYSLLNGDPTLMAMVSGVYDFVPEDAQYPYVTIGDLAVGDNSALGVRGFQLVLNINVYSQAEGKAECLNMIERIKTLIEGQVLAISGYSNVYNKVSAVDTRRDADNEILNGKISISILARVA